MSVAQLAHSAVTEFEAYTGPPEVEADLGTDGTRAGAPRIGLPSLDELAAWHAARPAADEDVIGDDGSGDDDDGPSLAGDEETAAAATFIGELGSVLDTRQRQLGRAE